MKLNLGCGPHKLDGFENLDLPGWRFEDGLPYPDDSVTAITISHALMYVDVIDLRFVFTEIARVLIPGGVVRITEDNTTDPASERYGGYPDAVTKTSPFLLERFLATSGLQWHHVGQAKTCFSDESLIQHWHGDPPKVFFIEGVKPE